MSQHVLTRDVYTPEAIDAGITAFATLLRASAHHDQAQSVIDVTSSDDRVTRELLNYILATSAQELLS